MPSRPLHERFWEKVDRRGPDECWEWTASRTHRGYGRIRSEVGRHAHAHRVAYELLVGPIPEGLVIDHLCRNRGCVNPAHLEPVTAEENHRRGDHSKPLWSHCKQGHPLEGENLYVRASGESAGKRQCQICRREAWRRQRAKRNAALLVVASEKNRPTRRSQ